MTEEINVIGTGTMGRGIALSFATAGFKVKLHDSSLESIDKELDYIDKSLDLMIECGLFNNIRKKEILKNIYAEKNFEKSIKNASVIIESIPEDLKMKQKLFQRIELINNNFNMICSNTSRFPLKKLIQKSQFKERYLITHYFNPAEIIPLVEVVKGKYTDEKVVDIVLTLLKKANKSPVLIEKEINGFIGNRLQAALLREAISLIEAGVATPENIDNVVKNGLGFRWAFLGPIEICEFGGWDIWMEVVKNLFPSLDNRGDVPNIINKLLEENRLGIKTNYGLYKYSEKEAVSKILKRDKSFLEFLKLRERILIKEANRENIN